MDTLRRKFLQLSGVLIGTYAFDAMKSPANAATAEATPETTTDATTIRIVPERFPQGVASADPQSTGILLWTRALPAQGSSNVALVVQVSESADFRTLVLERSLQATAASDHTVRVLVSSLTSDTRYYYRFVTDDGASSRIGRTWTAPTPDTDKAVNIAFLCCNSLQAGFFNTYRHLINSEGKDAASRVDFVLHLGDFIYENVPDPDAEPPRYTDGRPKVVTPFAADALPGPRGTRLATTLADYRSLYRDYLSDPDLQEARALFPFVHVWDDHEYGDDAWQTFTGDVARPSRKLQANQAWFEYVPAILTESAPVTGAEAHASDFQTVEVEDTPVAAFDDNFLATEANTLAALQSMTIYRSLRWGANMELILTDQRTYRSPAGTPEIGTSFIGDGESALNPDRGLPYEAVMTFAAGREYMNGNPPATLVINGQTVPNSRRDSPPVTMLGARQKQWFKDSLQASTARWKIWGSPLPVQHFNVDYSAMDPKRDDAVMWPGDNWDGFPNERNELMAFIRDQGITNVFSLSGDRHLHAVSLVADDYLSPNPHFVLADFAATCMAMATRADTQGQVFSAMGIPQLNSYRAATAEGKTGVMANLNVLFRHGTRAAQVMADTNDLTQALAVKSNPNPAMHMIDTRILGYGIAHVGAADVQVDLLGLDAESRNAHHGAEGPPLKYRAAFRLPNWQRGAEPQLQRLAQQGDTVFGELPA